VGDRSQRDVRAEGPSHIDYSRAYRGVHRHCQQQADDRDEPQAGLGVAVCGAHVAAEVRESMVRGVGESGGGGGGGSRPVEKEHDVDCGREGNDFDGGVAEGCCVVW
jgi:hypothetical protein